MRLKPNEIIFLSILDGKPENFEYSDKYKYNYGIYPEREIKKLENLGYIQAKLDIWNSLYNLKNTELKQILKNHNLEVGGKKQILVERILRNIDVDYLEEKFGEIYYFITEKGKQIIKNNFLYIINDKENYDFSDKEIADAYSLHPVLSDSDRIWNILTNRKDQHYAQKKYYEIKYDYYRMANFLYKEDKFNVAINYFIAYFILDLSMLNDSSDIEYTYVESSVISKIKNCISLLNISNIDELILKNNLCNTIKCYYTKEQLCIILEDSLQGIDYDYRKYYKKNIHTANNIHAPYKKKKISILKLILALCTCGISLIFTGIHK